VEERLWTPEEANAARDRVAAVVERARAAGKAVVAAGAPEHPEGNGQVEAPGDRSELDRALRDLADEGIVLRDLGRGLVDFAARAPSGRRYWLCWVVGEPEVAWWHWPEDGFAGRTPLSDPPS
jgi:hypothetical protein